MSLKILKVNHDGMTGHITAIVRAEEETTPGNFTYGPEEKVGIWPDALMSRFHGELEPTEETIHQALHGWLSDHHDKALQRKRHMDACRTAVAKLAGKCLEFSK